MRLDRSKRPAGRSFSAADIDTTSAFVGLGANLGDPAATLRAALTELASMPDTTLTASSSIYRSAPVDAQGPDFLNAVVELATRLEPQQLLLQLQRIEAMHRRERPFRNAPRTLDLDLLLFGDHCIETAELTVPHPRLHLRAFVLLPLVEIAPEVVIPGHGRASDWLSTVGDQRLSRWPEQPGCGEPP